MSDTLEVLIQDDLSDLEDFQLTVRPHPLCVICGQPIEPGDLLTDNTTGGAIPYHIKHWGITDIEELTRIINNE